MCSESASFDLPAGVLASCVQEVQSALEIALVRREDGSAHRGGEIFVAGAGKDTTLPDKSARPCSQGHHMLCCTLFLVLVMCIYWIGIAVVWLDLPAYVTGGLVFNHGGLVCRCRWQGQLL